MLRSKPKHKSLANQIVIFIFSFILAVWLLSTLLTRHLMSGVMKRNAEESVEYLANQSIFQIESRLKKIQTHASDLALLIDSISPENPTVEALIKKILIASPEIESICIAFKSSRVPESAKAVQYINELNQIRQINLNNQSFMFRSWFHIPMLTQVDYWSEPWYDSIGTRKTITTYSIPFSINGITSGVVRIDLSIDHLQRVVMPHQLKRSGYSLLISSKGTIVSHPNDDLVMNESIFSLAQELQDNQLRDIGRDMLRGNKAFVKLVGSETLKGQWIFYAPLISNSWSLGIIISDSDVFKDLRLLLLIQLLIAFAGFLILAVIVYARTLHIYKPLKMLTKVAQMIGAGNFDTDIPLSNTVNEISMLEESLLSMKNSLGGYVDNLRKTTEEKNKIQSEVLFASDIQKKLIPSNDNPLCCSPELRIYGVVEPASGIGGDLYDYFMVDENHFCFVIADVLGKGIAAAMTMVMVSTLIRSKAAKFSTIREVLKDINLYLCENSHESNFVTINLGLLNIKTGELEYSNAGHVPMYIRKANRKLLKYAETHSTALGVFPNIAIASDTIQLDLGDEIILFTDGITEAMSTTEAFFGYQRLENILEGITVQKPEFTVKAILNGVKQFSDSNKQTDDITILVMDFLHPKRKK